jgi:hypothetical protein
MNRKYPHPYSWNKIKNSGTYIKGVFYASEEPLHTEEDIFSDKPMKEFSIDNAVVLKKKIPVKSNRPNKQKETSRKIKVGDLVIHEDGTKGKVIKMLTKKDSGLLKQRWPDKNINPEGWIMIKWENDNKKNPFFTGTGKKINKY